jgi:hypothetical protein
MLYQNPAIQSRVEVHLVEEAKGGPSKLLLSFLFGGGSHLESGWSLPVLHF